MTCTGPLHRLADGTFEVPATQVVRTYFGLVSITRAYCFGCCEDAVFDAIHSKVPYAVRTLELHTQVALTGVPYAVARIPDMPLEVAN